MQNKEKGFLFTIFSLVEKQAKKQKQSKVTFIKLLNQKIVKLTLVVVLVTNKVSESVKALVS